MIDFYKYHGAGNDFIMIDNRDASFNGDKVAFAQKWCSRRFGIGSDGIIFIELSDGVDFLMDFYNPDGSQSFCGNGSRCAVAFAKQLGMIENEASFFAIDGRHDAAVDGNQVHVHMGNVEGVERIGEDFFIHTGSPHYISYCGKDDKRSIFEYGKQIRYSERFKEEGTNVNLIKVKGEDHIAIETYERGVENETLACGTGVTAAALSFGIRNDLTNGTVKVDAKGGKLQVKFVRNNDTFSEIWLIGPAEFVFKGIIE